jgi:hypothetical protein
MGSTHIFATVEAFRIRNDSTSPLLIRLRGMGLKFCLRLAGLDTYAAKLLHLNRMKPLSLLNQNHVHTQVRFMQYWMQRRRTGSTVLTNTPSMSHQITCVHNRLKSL